MIPARVPLYWSSRHWSAILFVPRAPFIRQTGRYWIQVASFAPNLHGNVVNQFSGDPARRFVRDLTVHNTKTVSPKTLSFASHAGYIIPTFVSSLKPISISHLPSTLRIHLLPAIPPIQLLLFLIHNHHTNGSQHPPLSATLRSIRWTATSTPSRELCGTNTGTNQLARRNGQRFPPACGVGSPPTPAKHDHHAEHANRSHPYRQHGRRRIPEDDLRGTPLWKLDGSLDSFSEWTVWKADDHFKAQIYEGRIEFWDGPTSVPPTEFYFRYGELAEAAVAPPNFCIATKCSQADILAAMQSKSTQFLLLDARPYASSDEVGMGPSPICSVIYPLEIPGSTQWRIKWRLPYGTAVASAKKRASMS
ncbi:hypothetical protein FRB94_004045 [Tulasnella sp. JGI-2019a]|nr:hypothetical protein FRB94_004045 [Tulasnella sp. JGI-2019a]